MALSSAFFTVLVLGCLVTYSIVEYGSVAGALSAANGEKLLILPDNVQINLVDPDVESTLSVNLKNVSDQPIDVALLYSNCNCAKELNLPITIPIGQMGRVDFTFRTPQYAGFFQRKLQIATTHGQRA